jgi:hypothetical protein
MKKPVSRKAAARAEAPSFTQADIDAGERLIEKYTLHSATRTAIAPVRKRPFFLRRAPMENIATLLIAAGFLMMFQSFALALYTWSFLTMLAGTVMFIFVSKFPE